MTNIDQKLTDLSTKIDKLEDESYISYVFARSEVDTNEEACKRSGVSHAKFYGWPIETRNYLNSLAIELKKATAFKAKMILSEATEKAANIKVSGMNSSNEHIQQSASTEILDRMLGKPTQKTELSGPKGQPVTIIEIIKSNGTLPTE